MENLKLLSKKQSLWFGIFPIVVGVVFLILPKIKEKKNGRNN